jgi:hypothetical protein
MPYVIPETVIASTTTSAAKFNKLVADILELWKGAAAGDTDYYISATEKVRLAKGTANQVYWMNAGATAPEWALLASLQAYLLSVALPENTALILDAALSADGKYSGIVEEGTAGVALGFGYLAYYSVADSRWELADADAAATAFGKLGLCVLAAADGAATKILLWGKINAASLFPTLTVGAPVFVSTSAGHVQVAAPTGSGDIVRIVGYGNTADELFFCPDKTYLELA